VAGLRKGITNHVDVLEDADDLRGKALAAGVVPLVLLKYMRASYSPFFVPWKSKAAQSQEGGGA